MKKQLLIKTLQRIVRSKILSILFFISLLFSFGFSQSVSAQDAFITNHGASTTCEGESTTLHVVIAASIGPYTVVYNDGTSDFTVNSYTSDGDIESAGYGGDPISVSPTVTTTYSLVSVLDQFNTSLPISAATVTITVNPLPTNIIPTVNSGNSVCYGVPFTINATATNGATFELWNEANTAKVGDGIIPYTATITSDTNFNIVAISGDGCKSSVP